MQVLRQYIAWTKQSFCPVLSEEAEELLSAYYMLLRQSGGRPGVAGQASWEWEGRGRMQHLKRHKISIFSAFLFCVAWPLFPYFLPAWHIHVFQGTVRKLESLVRVAQAHARLMAGSYVTMQDAVVAIAVMEACAGGSVLALDGPDGPLGTDFNAFPKVRSRGELLMLGGAGCHLHGTAADAPLLRGTSAGS